MVPAMRSKASCVTCAEGAAPAQQDGSKVQPWARAAAMKPPTGMLDPVKCSTMSGPST